MPIPALPYPPLSGTTVLLLVEIAALLLLLQATIVRRLMRTILSLPPARPGRTLPPKLPPFFARLSARPPVHRGAPAAPDGETTSSAPLPPPPA